MRPVDLPPFFSKNQVSPTQPPPSIPLALSSEVKRQATSKLKSDQKRQASKESFKEQNHP
jgi:hypothetical protein